jgi:hypothetical protein
LRNRGKRNVLTTCRALLLALGIFAVLAFAAPSQAQIGVGVVVSVAPPELPVYDQPICPGDDYIWTPGYWDWDPDAGDYFWVPGTWVLAPEPGFLWTPGYWGWRDTGYFWTAGYWGPLVGFYGGINYGFGYWGHGFDGGRWQGGHFFYNRAVMNVNVNVHNVYEERVNERQETRVSFNGGNGGVNARPTSQEEAAARERHVGPVAAQTQHVQEARGNRELRASVNHGAPPVAATAKPADFRTGVVKTREAGRVNTAPANGRPGGNEARPGTEGRPNNEARPNETTNANRPNAPTHARDIPPAEKLPAPNTGNSKTDQKYQQQQQKLEQKQAQERQKLDQQQEKEHQQAQKQQANQARQQQMEQRHQQQTQQLQQRQQQQRQQMQQRQAPHPAPAPKPAPEKPH